ncbi:MAG: hypothetical protein IKT99_02345 [Oscillospiraceae bacterium]|nr:hypothetical protein [Oscillospiraceae bacterium]
MNQTNVTGYCFMDEDSNKLSKGAAVFVTAAAFLLIGFAVWMRWKLMVVPGVLILLVMACRVVTKRYGCDPDAVFELSETGIQTTSVSKKMCRRFSWAETSVIQITRVEGTRMTPPMEYYVFVRGRDNALSESHALETYGRLFKNPNRIAICKSEKTRPFVTAIAERYGIPIEYSYMA